MPRQFGPVPSKTDHALYQEIRACLACSLADTCQAPVPPVGPVPARVMVLMEAPASNEQKHGVPVTGATWTELEPLLELADLSRDTVWLSNSLFCTPVDDPTLEDAQFCFDHWKPVELAMVKPSIIVACGQLAIRRLFNDPELTVAEVRGYPVWHEYLLDGDVQWEGWVLPTYHPAAALHQDSMRPALREDFLNLRRLKMGQTWERPVDEYPDPKYAQGLPEWL